MYANDSAISSFSRALDLLDQSGKSLASDMGLLKEKIADVYRTSGKYKNATEHYQEVLGLEKNIKSKRKSKYLPWKVHFSTRKSELCRKIAITVEAQSDFSKSIEWLDEALSNLPKRPGGLASRIAAMRSGVLYRMGKYKDGMQWGEKALKHAKRLNIGEDMAYAQNILALIYLAEGKMKKATDGFIKVVEFYDELNDFPSVANAKSNLANSYMWSGDLSSAIHNYSLALEADERVHNVSNIAVDHTNLAEVLIMMGDTDQAKIHVGIVQKTYEDDMCPPDLAGLALVHLCGCEIADGDLSKAQLAIEKGLELIKSTGQKLLLIIAELQMLELLIAKKEYGIAEGRCMEVMDTIMDLELRLFEVKGNRILAEIKKELGFEDEAVDYVHESIEMAIEIGAKYDEAKGVVVMVSIMREMLNAPMIQSAQDKCLGRVIKMLEKMGAKRELLKANSLILH